MQDHKASLKADIDRMTQILLYTQESFIIADYLIKTEKISYLNTIKKRNVFFEYVKHQSWRVMVIELCKLYYFKSGSKENTNNREQFNLRHLIKRLQPGGVYDWVGVQQEIIADWLAEMDRLDPFILDLLHLRDKRLAHDDRQVYAFNNVSRKYIQRMINIAQYILSLTSIKGLDEGMSFQLVRSPSDALKKIIIQLADAQCSKDK
ncbi:hypothetical protein [Mucilaginibacter sp. dw_454]|uniref:hypothetical protein n=1 Tax=Mucilaginibacter sp. dw_454 TaxID=2720079 RepID=UPI001BD25B18|nr:hypothetical protein [Mucilaginibacter sp. dw_454]